MVQKRVLVIGAILLAAGIGAPTTAFLAPGGALTEPRTPAVRAPVAPRPAEFEAPVSTVRTLPRMSASPVPPGAGLMAEPSPARAVPKSVGTGQAAQLEPPRDPRPAPAFDDDPRPIPALQSDHPDVVPPPPLPNDDWDPADQ